MLVGPRGLCFALRAALSALECNLQDWREEVLQEQVEIELSLEISVQCGKLLCEAAQHLWAMPRQCPQQASPHLCVFSTIVVHSKQMNQQWSLGRQSRVAVLGCPRRYKVTLDRANLMSSDQCIWSTTTSLNEFQESKLLKWFDNHFEHSWVQPHNLDQATCQRAKIQRI